MRRTLAVAARLVAVAGWTMVPLSLSTVPAYAADCGGVSYAESVVGAGGQCQSAPIAGAGGAAGGIGLGLAGNGAYNYWKGGQESSGGGSQSKESGKGDGKGKGQSSGGPPPQKPGPDRQPQKPAPQQPRARGGAGNPRAAGQNPNTRPKLGDPVDPITGDMHVATTDVELPGALPLLIERTHLSSYRTGRWFGPTWASTLDQRIELDSQGAVLVLPDGRLLVYPVPRPGEPTLPLEGERWPLTWDGGAASALRVIAPETGETLEFAMSGRSPDQDGTTVLPLTSLTDRRGDRITFEYTDDGAPRAVRHSGGYHIAVATENGRVTALSLAGGGDGTELVRYGYNPAGHLAEVVNSSGLPMRWAYDDQGRINGWADRNGSWYRYEYDALGRCVRCVGPNGSLSGSFAYDPVNRATTHTDANGHQRRYHYNGANQLIAEVDPLGGVVRKEWDRYDRLLSQTDPLGRTTRFTYDQAGRLTTVTHPDATEETATYNDAGLPLTVTAPDGAVWRQTYDDRGNRTSVTDPAEATTRFTYDTAGHPASLTDPLGNTTRIRCNAAGLPVEITDPLGAVTTFQRDEFGRVVAHTSADGATTRFTWTVEGRPASQTDPDGSRQTWVYDGEGNCTAYTDASGATTTFEFTYFDLLAARTDPTGARHTFAYDPEMRLTQVTNPQGLTWTYAYDPAGRMVAETDFDGRTQRYTHDAAGRLASRTNALGQTVTLQRDARERLVSRNADGQVTTFSYDRTGHLLQAAGPDAVLTFGRDATGRLTTETCNGRTMAFTYDAAGRPTGRTTPSGAAQSWTYDAAGHRTALRTAGRTLEFARDPAGRELTRTFGQTVTLASTWDESGRLTGQSLATAAGSVLQRGYTYRPDGNLTAVDDPSSGPRTFDLDPAGRVTAVRGGNWSETYAYDAAGNLTEADWPQALPSAEARGERAYTGTRITRAGSIRYEHDAQGRVVLRQKTRLSRKPDTWRYTWDAEDHLTSVTTPDGTVWRYLYDPLGRRIAKQRLAEDGTVAEQTDFAWDGLTLVEQTTGPLTLTWDHDGLHPIAQTERVTDATTQEEIDSRFFAIVTDLVGTPTHLVDETGDLAWRTRTTLWGTTTWPTSSTAYTPLRFPGQYHDPETGLHYNVNRYYDPETARYTSPDPLGLSPAPNPVAYVSNPLAWSDPLGMSGCTRDLGLSGEAQRAIQKMENLKKDPLGDINSRPNHNHYAAARREAAGEVVARKPDGTPYDHIAELREARNGLDSVRRILEQEMRRLPDGLTERGLDVLLTKHAEAVRMLDSLNGFLHSIGHR